MFSDGTNCFFDLVISGRSRSEGAGDETPMAGFQRGHINYHLWSSNGLLSRPLRTGRATRSWAIVSSWAWSSSILCYSVAVMSSTTWSTTRSPPTPSVPISHVTLCPLCFIPLCFFFSYFHLIFPFTCSSFCFFVFSFLTLQIVFSKLFLLGLSLVSLY